MNLTIDIGNTSAKAALFEGERLVHAERLDHDFRHGVEALMERYAPTACALSNVAGRRAEVRDTLARLGIPVTELTWQSDVRAYGIEVVPEGLGADRLAAVLGAKALCPDRELLVIDAGTCVTYDYVSAGGFYVGGNISPGLALRLRAMHEHTALLPLIPLEGDAPLMGQDTDTALRSGVVNGTCFEIEGFIREDLRARNDVAVFFAGADALPFSEEIRRVLICEPRLVGIGLNRLLL